MSAVRLVINMHSVPGAAQDFAQAWQSHGEQVSREAGCLQYELFRSTVEPDHLALLELWADRDAFENHWELEQNRDPVRPDLLGSPRSRIGGRDSLELYWEQAQYRVDPESRLWVRR